MKRKEAIFKNYYLVIIPIKQTCDTFLFYDESNLKEEDDITSIKMSPLLFYTISTGLIIGMYGCLIMFSDKPKRTYVKDVTHRYPTRFQAKRLK